MRKQVSANKKSDRIRKEDIHIAVGFNVFLEHQLSYTTKAEKGEVHKVPVVQLGGGAFNITKTLSMLGVSPEYLTLETLGSATATAHSVALNFLLDQEPFRTDVIPVLERPYSSYYLLGSNAQTFAFGDRNMKVAQPTPSVIKNIAKVAKKAQIKIACEVQGDSVSIALASVFLKRADWQQSVLVPSRTLLSTKKIDTLLPHVTVLSLNRAEARLYWGRGFGDRRISSCPVPIVFVTNGPHEAVLKVGTTLYRATPTAVKNPKYPGGAGDAATATLVYELLVKKTTPQVALEKALKAGTKVLSKVTPHL